MGWPTQNFHHDWIQIPAVSPRLGKPTSTAAVLPALTRFEFKGIREHLEGLLAWIDTPLLDSIWMIAFFRQLIADIPQLSQFMRRTTRFQAFNEALLDPVRLFRWCLGQISPTWTFHEKSGLIISCRGLVWQLSFLAQVSTLFFPSSTWRIGPYYIYSPQMFPL